MAREHAAGHPRVEARTSRAGWPTAATVRAFYETAVHGDADAVDAVVHPDHEIHDPTLPRDFRGVEGARDLVSMYRSVGAIAARGSRSAVRSARLGRSRV